MADVHEDPFRLRVMMALTDVLEGISISGGYKHDMAGSVFRGRNIFGDAGGDEEGGDPIPMISILEAPIAPEQIRPPEESSKSTGLWDLLIQGFVEDDKVNPTDPAYRLAADCTKALAIAKNATSAARHTGGKPQPIMGIRAPNGNPAILDIYIGAPVCRPPDEVSGKAYFWLGITFKLAENLESPYG